jgi:hypothetical protein
MMTHLTIGDTWNYINNVEQKRGGKKMHCVDVGPTHETAAVKK